MATGARRRLSDPAARVQVRREDFRIVRFKQPRETLTIFLVDASGSSAFHRLAEAKGAVELLLADCYVRRDQVALAGVSRAGRRIAAAADALADARQALARRIAGWRRHPARDRPRPGLPHRADGDAARADPAARCADRWARPISRATDARAASAPKPMRWRRRATVRSPGSVRCWSIRRSSRIRRRAGSQTRCTLVICRCRARTPRPCRTLCARSVWRETMVSGLRRRLATQRLCLVFAQGVLSDVFRLDHKRIASTQAH